MNEIELLIFCIISWSVVGAMLLAPTDLFSKSGDDVNEQ